MSERRRGPAVARRQLRLKLRRARREAGLTQQEVASALDWSASKILRIENGTTAASVSDVIALLTCYPSLVDQRDELVELARESKSPPVVSKYSDALAPAFMMWLEHEAYADTIMQYEPIIVPGVLQTDEYAMAVVGTLLDTETDDRDPSRIVAARRARIESLIHRPGPTMDIIIDEAVVRRAVGNEEGSRGFEPMTEQIRHLKMLNTVGRAELGESIEPDLNPSISIQIVPLVSGAYQCMRSPFEIIDFRDEDEEQMMYWENPEGSQVIHEGSESIERYLRMFRAQKKRTPGPAEANKLLDRVLQEVT